MRVVEVAQVDAGDVVAAAVGDQRVAPVGCDRDTFGGFDAGVRDVRHLIFVEEVDAGDAVGAVIGDQREAGVRGDRNALRHAERAASALQRTGHRVVRAVDKVDADDVVASAIKTEETATVEGVIEGAIEGSGSENGEESETTNDTENGETNDGE